MKITKSQLKEIIKEALEGHYPDYPEGMFWEDADDFPEGWTHERYAQVDEIETELLNFMKEILPDHLTPKDKNFLYRDLEDELGRLANKVQQGADMRVAYEKVVMLVKTNLPERDEKEFYI